MKSMKMIRTMFSGLLAFFFIGCETKTTFEEPTVFISFAANNLNTQEAVEFTRVFPSIVIDGDKILDCKPGDVVQFSYGIYPDDKDAYEFTKINNVVYGLDWEKSFNSIKYVFSITIPELSPGRYPVTYETSFRLMERQSDFSLDPSVEYGFSDETSIILVIPE
ncbi:MAG: hypothetical protein ACI3ZP_06655 [Candidatus Cryptobacteroides sp.]